MKATKRKTFKTIQELYRVKARWTKNVNARNAKGRGVAYNSDVAAAWCLEGAILLCCPYSVNRVRTKLEKAIQLYAKGKDWAICEFNDARRTTIKDIRAVVKLANV